MAQLGTQVEALTAHYQAELVEPNEGGQISAGKARISSSVRHVEVLRLGSVRTSILGRPRLLPPHRHAGIYTVIWE